jgi:hypothetical protein
MEKALRSAVIEITWRIHLGVKPRAQKLHSRKSRFMQIITIRASPKRFLRSQVQAFPSAKSVPVSVRARNGALMNVSK